MTIRSPCSLLPHDIKYRTSDILAISYIRAQVSVTVDT